MNTKIVIESKEIMMVTGKTESAARRLAHRIRKEFSKDGNAAVEKMIVNALGIISTL